MTKRYLVRSTGEHCLTHAIEKYGLDHTLCGQHVDPETFKTVDFGIPECPSCQAVARRRDRHARH